MQWPWNHVIAAITLIIFGGIIAYKGKRKLFVKYVGLVITICGIIYMILFIAALMNFAENFAVS